jgi:cell wall-associated NlpC family hydrolase
MIRPLLSSLGLLLLLSACAGQPARTPPPTAIEKPEVSEPPQERAPVSGPRRMVLDTARDMLGKPYRYGGQSPRGFDCSGLVVYSYRRAGIQLPRTAAEQRRHAAPVSFAQLRPGDLLFFRLQGAKTSHVGIYMGEGRFIHAPSSGKRVTRSPLNHPYWSERLIGAGRYL